MHNSAPAYSRSQRQRPRGERKPPGSVLTFSADDAVPTPLADERRRLLDRYFDLGYSAISHALIDYWMARMSGSEFKLALLLLRSTIGDRNKRLDAEMCVSITLKQISERAGLTDRESVVRAIRDLEEKGIIRAQRAHRKTTTFTLDLVALLDPWVGKPDSTTQSRVGKADSSRGLGSENPTQEPIVESGKPTQNTPFESGNPTPIKEIKKAAAAAELSTAALSAPEWSEIRLLEQQVGSQIDGKQALALKAATEAAGLTLSHLRWFLRDEKFPSARNRLAVLFGIAKDFRERVAGIEWPADLSVSTPTPSRGLTSEEIFSA